jgi:hypothetical protein
MRAKLETILARDDEGKKKDPNFHLMLKLTCSLLTLVPYRSTVSSKCHRRKNRVMYVHRGSFQ